MVAFLNKLKSFFSDRDNKLIFSLLGIIIVVMFVGNFYDGLGENAFLFDKMLLMLFVFVNLLGVMKFFLAVAFGINLHLIVIFLFIILFSMLNNFTL